MHPSALSRDRFRLALTSDSSRLLFLSEEDVRGNWELLLPELASALPEPYPVYDPTEERVVQWGYPIAMSETLKKIVAQLSALVDRELRYRLEVEGADTRAVVKARELWSASIKKLFENAQLNDYGRGFVEILLLLISAQIQTVLRGVPGAVRELRGSSFDGDRLRIQLGTRLGAMVISAFSAAADQLRNLIDSPARRAGSPVLGLLFRDPLLLVEGSLPESSDRLAKLLPGRFDGKVQELLSAALEAETPMRKLLSDRTDIRGMLEEACPGGLDMKPFTLLQPCLLKMLEASALLRELGMSREQAHQLKAVGLHLKAVELVASLRRVLLPIVRSEEGVLSLLRNRKSIPIAASTRPPDFTMQGVVETSVFRFGVIYDLRDFSEVMEEIRKHGRQFEESALQFMYVFQGKMEKIAQRRRLRFEKFLGDGAFLTSRRARRALVAAIEIQAVYIDLRDRGFPFAKGMRVALNAGLYHLLPMRISSSGRPEYEFFGHGIVELARLSTGKSTREVHQVAQMLIGRGYNPESVEEFLRPLMEVRGEQNEEIQRPFPAYLDAHGELINEGIVLSLDFLENLEKELGPTEIREGRYDGSKWLVLDLSDEQLTLGLRFIGTTRLKGLAPMELVEAIRWPEKETGAVEGKAGLKALLRRFSRGDSADPQPGNSSVPENLVVATYREKTGKRSWILGQYRKSDGMLLHALKIPLDVPQKDAEEQLEVWLFKNRADLAKMYEVLLRSTSGRAFPISKLNSMTDATICFLAAPHRTPL